MLASKSSETLHFDEHKIIKFLERFKKNVMNMKSSRKNDEMKFLIIVLGSLQSL